MRELPSLCSPTRHFSANPHARGISGRAHMPIWRAAQAEAHQVPAARKQPLSRANNSACQRLGAANRRTSLASAASLFAPFMQGAVVSSQPIPSTSGLGQFWLLKPMPGEAVGEELKEAQLAGQGCPQGGLQTGAPASATGAAAQPKVRKRCGCVHNHEKRHISTLGYGAL